MRNVGLREWTMRVGSGEGGGGGWGVTHFGVTLGEVSLGLSLRSQVLLVARQGWRHWNEDIRAADLLLHRLCIPARQHHR